MATRFWPLGAGRIVTSPFGLRKSGFHYGVDFGRDGGSAGMSVYAIQAGTVIHAGAADGYGGPDPAGWLVIDSTDAEGGGCLEYGHIIREVARGDRVTAGQRIGRINPDSRTNGGTAPHLHLSDMPHGYDPRAKQDPMPRLRGALEPGGTVVSGQLTWLADVVRPAVADFVEYPGWRTRGHGNFKDVRGVMVHHMGGRGGPKTIAEGRPDLAGPLSQFTVQQTGQVNLVAAGLLGHKDYAGHAQGKWDPWNLDVTGWFASEVGKDMSGFVFPGERPAGGPTPAPVPAPVPPVDRYAGVLLHRGMRGDDVVKLQFALKRWYSTLVVDGDFGPRTEACVRDWQKLRPPLAATASSGANPARNPSSHPE